ncbi:MAG: FecR family protein [Pseudomonadota bacterium]
MPGTQDDKQDDKRNDNRNSELGDPFAGRFDQLARVARGWADGDTAGRDEAQPSRWLELEQTMERNRRSAARRRVLGVSTAAMTAVAALVLVRGWGRAEQRVTFTIVDGAASLDGTVQASRTPARVSFSDGSAVVLNPGARGAVLGTTVRGARVRLEQGHARFSVAHRRETEWSVEAGPFTVVVHGTVFDLSWTGQSGALAVDLMVGSVTVKGPVRGGSVTLGAGQRLTAQAATGRTQVDPIGAPPAGAGGVSPAEESAAADTGGDSEVAARDDVLPSASPALPGGGAHGSGATFSGARSSRRPAASIADVSATWESRVAAGQFQSVVDAADKAGIERCLAAVPAASLGALADAARYARRTDLARRALLAERRRFGGTVGAHDAAFLIGRLAEDADGDLREALRWYDRYLEEGAAGTYASEALGRKMLALDRLGEAEDARAVAGRYLDGFPTGAFAIRARRLQAGR